MASLLCLHRAISRDQREYKYTCSTMMTLSVISALLFRTLVAALPSGTLPLDDLNPQGHPFLGSSIANQPNTTSILGIFKRQGCPAMTLLCPSGGCCPYEGSCCGKVCCTSGYVCSGGTSSSPCCVAIGDLSATCGGSSGNVSEQGTYPVQEGRGANL